MTDRARSTRALRAMLGFAVVLGACIGRARGANAAPVTLAIDGEAAGKPVAAHYIGLSFETTSLQPGAAGAPGYLFDSADRQLLTLFRNLGVRNLRIGGTSTDRNQAGYVPERADIDALFRFADAADVNVIYSLQLLNGNPRNDAATARYIWENYRRRLDCFAIGNEPNLYKGRDRQITDAASFVAKWRRFADVVKGAVPDCALGGPDTGTGGTAWAEEFGRREAGTGLVATLTAHYYVGGGSHGKRAPELIDEMLSPEWDGAKFPAYYQRLGAMALSVGLPYRLTELNSFVADFPGVAGGNNAFATALFSLDCMHWWALHGCQGVNFHTVLGKYNGTIYRDAQGSCQVHPLGYGIKAFDLGGRGEERLVTVANPAGINFCAYAVTDADGACFFTVINKEHGAGARAAAVTIHGVFARAQVIYLRASDGGGDATDATLGGAAIRNDRPWSGHWTALERGNAQSTELMVPPSSAAIVRMSG